MIDIRKIIDCLTISEIGFLQVTYNSKPLIHEKKLRLLNFILEGNASTDYEASMQIYNQVPSSAFSHLKKRLKEDLLNSLLHKASSSPEPKTKAEIKARKLHLQGLVLKSQGRDELALQLIQKALKISIEYELYDIQVTIYEYLGSNYDERRRREEHTHNSWDKSMSVLNKLRKIHLAKSITTTRGSNWRQFQSNRESSNSGLLEYWNCSKQLKLFKTKKEFSKAYSCGLKAVSVVNDRSQIFAREEKFLIYLEMAKLSLCQNRIDSSIEFTAKAMEASYSDESERSALEILFYIHFFKKDWGKVKRIIRKVDDCCHSKSEVDDWPRWKFYSANLKFMKNDFRESIKCLNIQIRQVRCNEKAFVTGNRLLEILNLVEMRDYDWLQFRMESFRKQLKTSTHDYKYRYMGIYKLIRALMRNNFDYKTTYNEEGNILGQLKECKSSFYKDPLGFEIIDTYEWFCSKV